ncbi:hypothetical protein BGZ63DRAFT_197976 [Mariannaea sp. PMI_226]|nr:hypothetical protein BGZ63DRAFT_197976 [Mariannaea sp. PMI_226]
MQQISGQLNLIYSVFIRWVGTLISSTVAAVEEADFAPRIAPSPSRTRRRRWTTLGKLDLPSVASGHGDVDHAEQLSDFASSRGQVRSLVSAAKSDIRSALCNLGSSQVLAPVNLTSNALLDDR